MRDRQRHKIHSPRARLITAAATQALAPVPHRDGTHSTDKRHRRCRSLRRGQARAHLAADAVPVTIRPVAAKPVQQQLEQVDNELEFRHRIDCPNAGHRGDALRACVAMLRRIDPRLRRYLLGGSRGTGRRPRWQRPRTCSCLPERSRGNCIPLGLEERHHHVTHALELA